MSEIFFKLAVFVVVWYFVYIIGRFISNRLNIFLGIAYILLVVGGAFKIYEIGVERGFPKEYYIGGVLIVLALIPDVILLVWRSFKLFFVYVLNFFIMLFRFFGRFGGGFNIRSVIDGIEKGIFKIGKLFIEFIDLSILFIERTKEKYFYSSKEDFEDRNESSGYKKAYEEIQKKYLELERAYSDLKEELKRKEKEFQEEKERFKKEKEAFTRNRYSEDFSFLDPYEVLGISKNASIQEIKRAFYKKIQEYHPDKVASLGEKLKIVAEEETKKINWAWEKIKKEKGIG